MNESVDLLDISLSDIYEYKFVEKELIIKEREKFKKDDLIKMLKQFENNRHIKPMKNLMLSKEIVVIYLLNSIYKIARETLMTEEGELDMNMIKELKKNYLVFPMSKKDNKWLNIVICTKKGQIRLI